MSQPFKSLLVASLLLGVALTSAVAAEREDVRKAINLVTSVKMPFPEGLSRNRAKTERVWLEREGATTGCIRLEDRRWCYDHIAPKGNRAETARPEARWNFECESCLLAPAGRCSKIVISSALHRVGSMGLLDVDAGKRLWVAAAPREDAVALVLGAMPEGWSAALLDTRLKPDEVVLLNACASAI